MVRLSTLVSAAEVTDFKQAGASLFNVYPYDETKTYNVNDALYVDSEGKLTNDAAVAEQDGKNFAGTVIEPATATKSAMKVYVNIR